MSKLNEALAELDAKGPTVPYHMRNPRSFNEDASWLRTLRADYANLIELLKADGVLEDYYSSWDQEAHEEALERTEHAIDEIEQMFPFDPASDPTTNYKAQRKPS